MALIVKTIAYEETQQCYDCMYCNNFILTVFESELVLSHTCTLHRECAKVLFDLVHIWPANILEKRYHMILENIKLRINDTSGETRLNAAR